MPQLSNLMFAPLLPHPAELQNRFASTPCVCPCSAPAPALLCSVEARLAELAMADSRFAVQVDWEEAEEVRRGGAGGGGAS